MLVIMIISTTILEEASYKQASSKAIIALVTERFHLLDPHHHYQFHLHHYDDDEPVPSKAIVALVAEHCLKVKVSALLFPDHWDISIIVNNQQDQCFCFRTRLL